MVELGSKVKGIRGESLSDSATPGQHQSAMIQKAPLLDLYAQFLTLKSEISTKPDPWVDRYSRALTDGRRWRAAAAYMGLAAVNPPNPAIHDRLAFAGARKGAPPVIAQLCQELVSL
jgi:hypothetical protein